MLRKKSSKNNLVQQQQKKRILQQNGYPRVIQSLYKSEALQNNSMAINYNITQVVENNRYIINFKFYLPVLSIKHTLNFRIYNAAYHFGESKKDVFIDDSDCMKQFHNSDFNTSVDFSFNFNIDKLQSIKNLTFGFCNENVSWHQQTFITVNIDNRLINPFGVLPAPVKQITPDSNKAFHSKKVCILSTWNIKCGISQYCRHVYDALINKKYEVTVVDDATDYDDIFTLITKLRFDIFIVQYELSIIKNIDRLIDCLRKIKQTTPQTKIYFIIHSENATLNRVDGIINGFIYHKHNKLSFQQTRTWVIPMGVPIFDPQHDKKNYRTKYGIDENKFIISTVGFMFKWKQHAQFLERMTEYLRQYNNITIQLLTSFHSINHKECAEECEKISNIIHKNNLYNQVIHITNYIPQDELNERLFLSNLGFLWASIETTSSSASLKEFVSSRLPVVRTDSNHWHDINVGCITTPKDMNKFVHKMIDIYNSSDILNELQQEMNDVYDKLNYNKIVDKFVEIFNG